MELHSRENHLWIFDGELSDGTSVSCSFESEEIDRGSACNDRPSLEASLLQLVISTWTNMNPAPWQKTGQTMHGNTVSYKVNNDIIWNHCDVMIQRLDIKHSVLYRVFVSWHIIYTHARTHLPCIYNLCISLLEFAWSCRIWCLKSESQHIARSYFASCVLANWHEPCELWPCPILWLPWSCWQSACSPVSPLGRRVFTVFTLIYWLVLLLRSWIHFLVCQDLVRNK